MLALGHHAEVQVELTGEERNGGRARPSDVPFSLAQDSSEWRHSLPYLAAPYHHRNRHGAGAGAVRGSYEGDSLAPGSVCVGEEDRRACLIGNAGEIGTLR
jgi:hypothetical protein